MMKRSASVDWAAVEQLMVRCKRGQGYVPEEHERKLLQRAVAEDLVRYRQLGDDTWRAAVNEMIGKGSRGS